jgi:hypothetical protein
MGTPTRIEGRMRREVGHRTKAGKLKEPEERSSLKFLIAGVTLLTEIQSLSIVQRTDEAILQCLISLFHGI